MPRARRDEAKSSDELEKEIKALEQILARKRKVRDAVKRREDAEAEQARTIAEAQFNKEFVTAAQEVRLIDGRTVYELIHNMIRPLTSPEAEQETANPEQG